MRRWIAAAAVVVVLALLFGWQHQREQAIARCTQDGGLWDGAKSRCVPDPTRVILQRDLHRS
jgi:hypothetical protein